METNAPTVDDRIARLESRVAALLATVTSLTTRLAAAEANVPLPTATHPCSSSLRPRFPEPTHFDGDRRKGRTFIEALELYVSAVSFEDDQHAIAWALSFCSLGRAVFVRREYLTQQRSWSSWAAFIAHMKSEFLPIGERTRHAVMLQGTGYYQGQHSVDEYIDTFRDICREAGYNLASTLGAEAEHLVLLFRRGLDPSINDSMVYRGSTPTAADLFGWFDAARQIARALEENRIFKATVGAAHCDPVGSSCAHIFPKMSASLPCLTSAAEQGDTGMMELQDTLEDSEATPVGFWSHHG